MAYLKLKTYIMHDKIASFKDQLEIFKPNKGSQSKKNIIGHF